MRADIMKGNLAGAILIRTDLTDSNLRGAHFDATVFRETALKRTNLMEACFRPSNLHSNLKGSGVSDGILHADFEGSAMFRTILVDMDLSTAKGLETVNHAGPSHIGIDTIYRSQGKIPEVFLRGAGVPENLIEYMRSLAGQSFEFYSSFISHSSKDRVFAERLYTDLQAKGVRCWYFPEDAGWGEPVWGEIDRAIKIYDKLVVICSADSLQSRPVIREIERSLQREDSENRNILFPIRIDNYLFERWEHPRKADVLSKVVGDFRNWKDHDSYQNALNRLLKSLQGKIEKEVIAC